MIQIPLTTGKNMEPPTMASYNCSTPCTWCGGCGDFGIWAAIKKTLVELGIHPWQVMLAFDIGCHGNMSDKMLGYRFHGLHGRVIPWAAAAALVNRRVPVIAFGGDGASFSEGIGHLIHGVRSNYPITFVLHNNGNYGLTTGQASSLTPQGEVMNSSPNGIPERTLSPMDLIFSLEPSFVARGFSGDIPALVEIFKAAIQHNGFSYIDVLQECPTWNKFATHEYLLERCYNVADDKHDTTDFQAARSLAINTGNKIATGVLYQNINIPCFYDQLVARRGIDTSAVDEVERTDVTEIMKRFV